MKSFKALLAAVALVGTAVCYAGQIPEKPVPERLVNDFAGAFTQEQVDSLEKVLVAFDDSTSNQIAVVTVTTLGGSEVADFALRLGKAWGVGSKSNNGVVVLLKTRGTTEEEKYVDVSIQTGYGLEGAIPDVYAYRIIQKTMGPHLVKDEYFEAVSKACDQLMTLASGEKIPELEPKKGGLWNFLLTITGISLVLYILSLIRKKKKKDGDDDKPSGGDTEDSNDTHHTTYTGPVIINTPHFDPPKGGFGGFGGGSFGGGGASGRF